MPILELGVEEYAQNIVANGGVLLLPTDPSTVGETNYPLDQLVRDQHGIVMQSGDDNSIDGGDSAHRTGILAFCGNAQDKRLLDAFEEDGVMVRHPTAKPWDNPKNCSRDQLLAFVAGCWRAGRTDIVTRLLQATEGRDNTCQNIENDEPGTTKNPPIGDLIFSHEHMFLRVCAGQQNAHWDLAGQWLLQVTIEAVKLQEDPEINQLILESIVCCRLDHFVEHVPDYEERLRGYWGGWRRKQQIADALVAVINTELERYKGFFGIPFPPIPIHTINEVINLFATTVQELQAGNYPHVLDPTQMARTLEDARDVLEASINDARAQFEYHAELGSKLFGVATQMASILGSTGINPLALLGGTRDEDLNEIKRALDEISAKLDQVIAFLKNDLGPVVRAAVEQTLTDVRLRDTANDIATVIIPLMVVIENPEERAEQAKHLDELRAETGKIVTAVTTVIGMSKIIAPLAVQSFISVFSSGSLLLRHDFAAYSPFVSAWCQSIAKVLQEAIVTSPTADKTLKDMASRLPTVAEATEAANLIPPTEPQHAIYWGYVSAPNLVGNPMIEPLEVRGVLVVAYGALLHHFDPATGQWQIDNNSRFSAILDQMPTNDDFLPIPPHNNYTKKSWWPLSVNFTGSWVDKGMEMKAEADQLTVKGHKLGAASALDGQIKMIEKVIAQAGTMDRAIADARL